MKPRRHSTVSVDVGGVLVGSAHPVVFHSVTNTDAADADGLAGGGGAATASAPTPRAAEAARARIARRGMIGRVDQGPLRRNNLSTFSLTSLQGRLDASWPSV